MLASFLKRAYCLRFLSICLLKDGAFPHHFKSQKTQFLQLFPHISPIVSPHKPRYFLPFRGHPSQQEFPIKSPASSPSSALSGVSFASETPVNSLHILPAISPFRGNIRGDFRGNISIFALIHCFLSDNFDPAKHEVGEVFRG